jgi:hypothetical protein
LQHWRDEIATAQDSCSFPPRTRLICLSPAED